MTRELEVIKSKAFMDARPPEPHWEINQWLPAEPGQRVMFAGSPKAGKSTLALDLAVSLSSYGGHYLGNRDWIASQNSRRVLYIQEENPVYQMWHDLESLYVGRGVMNWTANPHDLGNPDDPDDFGEAVDAEPVFASKGVDLMLHQRVNLTDASDVSQLHEIFTEERYEYVVLDSLYKLAPGVDLDKGWAVSFLLKVLDDMRAAFGITIIVIHHSGKDNERKAQARILHSTYLRAWYDALVAVEDRRKDGWQRVVREYRAFPTPDDVWLRRKPMPPGSTNWWERISWEWSLEEPEEPEPEDTKSQAKRKARLEKIEGMFAFSSMHNGLQDLIDIGDVTGIIRYLEKVDDWGVAEKTLRSDIKEVLKNYSR